MESFTTQKMKFSIKDFFSKCCQKPFFNKLDKNLNFITQQGTFYQQRILKSNERSRLENKFKVKSTYENLRHL